MKLKFLATLSLLAFMFLTGCGGNKDNTNVNVTTNKAAATATPTPLPQTSETGKTDPALQGKIEAALKAKGYKDVTVDTSTSPATLRGTYPKDKLADVMATAMEANGGKPVQNAAAGK